MSNTTLTGYYTTVFTDCDKRAFNYYYEPPADDPCSGGCPEGYTTNCQGDQTPDECGCCVNYTPLVVHIGEGQPRFGDPHQGPLFGINGSGSILRLAWPISENTGWLFLDRNGNGIVDNGSELFGNTTWLSGGVVAEHGYQALAALDDDGDGRVSSRDSRFKELQLWFDRNSDGVSQSDELQPLAVVGISALHTAPKESSRRDGWGTRYTYRAVIDFVSGQGYSYDVFPAALNVDGSPTCGPTAREAPFSGRR